MSKILASLFILVFIGGCAIKEVSQPIVTYSLTPDNVMQSSKTGQKILKLSRFKSPAFLRSKKIWYRYPSGVTDSYLYSKWNESFTDMIERSVAENIFKSGLFKSVYTKYSQIVPDMFLEGSIVNAIQNMSSVSFEIRLYLIDNKNTRLVSTKDFSYTQKCDTVDAKGAVDAYDKIVKRLNKDVRSWLQTLVKTN